MKKFAMLALLLSLGVFATGCPKTDTKKPETPPAADGAAPAEGAPAAAPAEAAPAEAPK
ncbi:MAG: hypothetical protein HY288_16210 [Planctomycetia bacterium]|nr:hypothetical protein [Planctomycetia bacterium]